MCGRFYIADEDETGEIQRMIEEAARKQKAILGCDTIARGEVAPGMTAAALALGKTGKRGVFPMEWGFSLEKKRIINTRLETADELPLFRSAFQTRRCLLPMTHYFEWENREEVIPSLLDGTGWEAKGKRRNRYAIRPEGNGRMYLAGIYRYEANKKLPVFSVLTCAPDESIAWLHERMPVILEEQTAMDFLHRAEDAEGRERCMVFRAG
ncbi:MAG: SOS response-associated peptidase family protein [Clostridia bacterium]|nr:SOS response-associated peptidase family protein [Clostridia bacterium]